MSHPPWRPVRLSAVRLPPSAPPGADTAVRMMANTWRGIRVMRVSAPGGSHSSAEDG